MTTEAICLIVDVELGESCGIEFAQHLANAGFTMPIIFMTADDNESVRRRAMEVGCVAFLPKPFAADVLIEALVNISPRLIAPLVTIRGSRAKIGRLRPVLPCGATNCTFERCRFGAIYLERFRPALQSRVASPTELILNLQFLLAFPSYLACPREC